ARSRGRGAPCRADASTLRQKWPTMAAAFLSGPTSGTTWTGDPWRAGTTTPTELPISAPATTSVGKWRPAITREAAIPEEPSIPRPSTAYGMPDLGSSLRSAMNVEVVMANASEVWLLMNDIDASELARRSFGALSE